MLSRRMPALPMLKQRLRALAPGRWRWALRIAVPAWLALLLSTSLLAYYACRVAQREAERITYARLELVRNAKQAEILSWYQSQLTAISQLATGGEARAMYLELHDWAQRKGVKPDGPFPVHEADYLEIWNQGTVLQNFVDMGGYRGLFIIDARTGQVLYATPNDIDNGVNLAQEPYSRSGVAECWRSCKDVTGEAARDGLCITDISFYPPGNTAWANQFIGIPLWHERPPRAVLVLQLELNELDRIVCSGLGLDRRGEAYIAGADRLLRTRTRRMFLQQATGAVLSTKVPQLPVTTVLEYDWSWQSGGRHRATVKAPTLAGPPGWAAATVLFPDYEMVWAAWPNQYDDFWRNRYQISMPRWALVVEQPRSEAMQPVARVVLQACGLALLLLLVLCRAAWHIALRLEARILALPGSAQGDEDA